MKKAVIGKRTQKNIIRLVTLGIVVILGILTKQIPSDSSGASSKKRAEIPAEATASSRVQHQATEEAVVSRVIDGDTIELTDGRRVRYIGVDTPETVDPRRAVACFGREASAENVRLVAGKTVRLEKDVSDTDKYQRLLRYVYVDLPSGAGEIFINEYLVRQGFARVATYPPDVKYAELFVKAEQTARRENLGLWSGCP
jgi:micrococcal nuclease